MYQVSAVSDGSIHGSLVEQVHLDNLKGSAFSHRQLSQMIDPDWVGGVPNGRSDVSATGEQVGYYMTPDVTTRPSNRDNSTAHDSGRGWCD